jgi:hypothetical protein
MGTASARLRTATFHELKTTDSPSPRTIGGLLVASFSPGIISILEWYNKIKAINIHDLLENRIGITFKLGKHIGQPGPKKLSKPPLPIKVTILTRGCISTEDL